MHIVLKWSYLRWLCYFYFFGPFRVCFFHHPIFAAWKYSPLLNHMSTIMNFTRHFLWTNQGRRWRAARRAAALPQRQLKRLFALVGGEQ